MSSYDYGYAYLEYPIKEGQVAIFDNGSKVAVHDIFNPLPKFMYSADLIFVDPPWNLGNLNAFYTKADRTDYVDEYERFYKRLFECIAEINPRKCYVEIGKQHLADFIIEMRKLYSKVTFFNSTYYHNKKYLCYVVFGTSEKSRLGYITAKELDYMDEEDIIKWVCANEDYDCIADLCIGQGLVAVNAYKNGKRFVGTELNPKRVSVLIERVVKLGASYQIADMKEGDFDSRGAFTKVHKGARSGKKKQLDLG